MIFVSKSRVCLSRNLVFSRNNRVATLVLVQSIVTCCQKCGNNFPGRILEYADANSHWMKTLPPIWSNIWACQNDCQLTNVDCTFANTHDPVFFCGITWSTSKFFISLRCNTFFVVIFLYSTCKTLSWLEITRLATNLGQPVGAKSFLRGGKFLNYVQ